MECKHCNSENIKKSGIERQTTGTYQRYKCNDCGRTTLTEMGEDIKEYKTEILDKMPVAVGWRVNGGSGYKTTMDTKGSAYIGKDGNGTLVLYIVIYSKFGMYQIRINKKRMYDMLKNVCKKDVNRNENVESD